MFFSKNANDSVNLARKFIIYLHSNGTKNWYFLTRQQNLAYKNLFLWKMRGRFTVPQTGCSVLQLAHLQQLCRLLPIGLVERETGIVFSRSSLSTSNPARHFLLPHQLTPCAKSLVFRACKSIDSRLRRWGNLMVNFDKTIFSP